MHKVELSDEEMNLVIDGLFLVRAEEETFIKNWKGDSTAAKCIIERVNKLIDRLTKVHVCS